VTCDGSSTLNDLRKYVVGYLAAAFGTEETIVLSSPSP
jgi:hypothetical protein